jgi:hypothetical protein
VNRRQLIRERLDYSRSSMWPVCDVCGRLIQRDLAVHHTIIARRHAQGWPKEQRGLIDHEYNLCILHNYHCHLKAAHGWLGLALVAVQIVRYGWGTIDEWVNGLPPIEEIGGAEIGGLPFKVPFMWHRGLTEAEALALVKEKVPWIKSA